jgi:CHC2 zinc finger
VDHYGPGSGSGFEIKCHCPYPEHEDKNPSASFSAESGAFVCFGCGSQGNWITLAHTLLTPSEAQELSVMLTGFEPGNGTNTHNTSQSAYWPPADEPFEPSPSKRYRNTSTATAMAAMRTRRFAVPYRMEARPRHKPDGITSEKQVPYQAPSLIEAVEFGETVFITEGEKDADALILQGVVATTFSAGWKDHFTGYFEGADVVIVADRDDDPVKPGLRKALRVAEALLGVAYR